MKKLIIFMSLILSVVPLGAQTKYRGIVEGGYSFLQDNKSGLSFQVSTIHGVRLGSYFIGGGIGLEGNQIDNPAYNPQADVQLLDECPCSISGRVYPSERCSGLSWNPEPASEYDCIMLSP